MGVSKRRRKKGGRRKPERFPLKELLAVRKVSQLELMRRTGMGQNRVNAIACGRVIPTWTTVIRICQALNVDLGELWKPPQQGGAA